MEDGSPKQALTVDALDNVATTIQENFSCLDAHFNNVETSPNRLERYLTVSRKISLLGVLLFSSF